MKSGDQRHMKSGEWKTYRTRFLVKAKRLSSNLSFVDSLGRLHSGRKGDYLVESSEGVVSIAPRQIFEDIYVAMGLDQGHRDRNDFNPKYRGALPGEIQVGRKLPQPCRGGPAGTRVGMM